MAGMLVPPLKGTIFAHPPTAVERPGWISVPASQKNANAETEASAFAVALRSRRAVSAAVQVPVQAQAPV
jgi:hypothetical protein